MDKEELIMKSVPETFGSLVFGNDIMRERLPKETYKALQKTIQEGLDMLLADIDKGLDSVRTKIGIDCSKVFIKRLVCLASDLNTA